MDKVADTLSNYYKKLHKVQDISAEAFEISDVESQDEYEGDLFFLLPSLHSSALNRISSDDEGISFDEWQRKRIKEEIKSFMKQLAIEVRNCHVFLRH